MWPRADLRGCLQLLEAQVERHPIRQYDVLGAPIDEAAVRGQQIAAQEQEDTAASTPLPQSPVVSNSSTPRPGYQRRGSASSLSQQLI